MNSLAFSNSLIDPAETCLPSSYVKKFVCCQVFFFFVCCLQILPLFIISATRYNSLYHMLQGSTHGRVFHSGFYTDSQFRQTEIPLPSQFWWTETNPVLRKRGLFYHPVQGYGIPLYFVLSIGRHGWQSVYQIVLHSVYRRSVHYFPNILLVRYLVLIFPHVFHSSVRCIWSINYTYSISFPAVHCNCRFQVFPLRYCHKWTL